MACALAAALKYVGRGRILFGATDDNNGRNASFGVKRRCMPSLSASAPGYGISRPALAAALGGCAALRGCRITPPAWRHRGRLMPIKAAYSRRPLDVETAALVAAGAAAGASAIVRAAKTRGVSA